VTECYSETKRGGYENFKNQNPVVVSKYATLQELRYFATFTESVTIEAQVGLQALLFLGHWGDPLCNQLHPQAQGVFPRIYCC
jgi:hypothetical protein